MEIGIRDGEQVVPNSVRQLSRGKFDVIYTPTNSGEHQTNVTFNGQHVTGRQLSHTCFSFSFSFFSS